MTTLSKEKEIGIIPAIIARLVIKMGLKRFAAAIAPILFKPRLLDLLKLALDTNSTALEIPIPNAMIQPMNDCMLIVFPVIKIISKEPVSIPGMTDITTSASLRD
jgi:hypothetical protein